MASVDYEKLARDIVEAVGADNITIVSHCMTRLRFTVKDKEKADMDGIRGLKGVMGVIYAGGQLMVILGQNLLPVYDSVLKQYHFQAGEVVNENLDAPKEKEPLTFKSAGNAVLSFVSTTVTPLVAGLIAGGMLKVFLMLITLAFPAFSGMPTYKLLSALADAPFYFMPIFVAFGAAQKLGGTPIYAMVCAATLIHGDFLAMVAAGEPVTMLMIPVRLVKYTSSLLPALLISLVACYAEKFFNKIVPGIFKSIFVGMGTIVVTMILGFTILGPLGAYAGDLLAGLFLGLGGVARPIAIGVLAACLPWLVMCGMHTALAPFMAQAIANPGYDPLIRPAFLLHNMAEGGACLGVALKTKNAQFRSEALSIAFGCIVAGVTEPAIYGINLRLKKPMYGVMGGAAIGGVAAGLLGARAYVMGYSNIMALPIFQDTLLAMLAAVIAAIAGAAVITFFLGFEEEARSGKASDAGNAGSAAPSGTAGENLAPAADTELVAAADGEMIDIATVQDEMFASKMMGDGVAFELKGDTIVAPCNGTLSAVFPTGHAFGIVRPDGVEVLVHIGINTVELQGKGFTVLGKADSQVKAGDPIVKLDLPELKKSGYDLTTMLIVTNTAGKEITFTGYGEKKRGMVISR